MRNFFEMDTSQLFKMGAGQLFEMGSRQSFEMEPATLLNHRDSTNSLNV